MQKRLIYRHLAWINALRLQLRRTTIFDRENCLRSSCRRPSNDVLL